MHTTDPFPVICPKCRKQTYKELGWFKNQRTLKCDTVGCWADMADELTEVQVAIWEAEKIAASLDRDRLVKMCPPSQEWFDGDEPKPF